jgi:arylsulfatase A-like enzyme
VAVDASLPSIVLVTSDQQRADTVGALGNPWIATPALDRLVREGIACERTYCANPLCSPSRASLLTGLLPSQHGCWNVGVALPTGVPTLPALLAPLGYRTALIGKAHLQPCLAPGSPEAAPHIFDAEHFRRWHGPYYGFDHCELAIGHTREPHAAGMHYGLWLRAQGVDVARYFGGAPSHHLDEGAGMEGRWDLPEAFHNSRWTADRAIAYLQERAEEQRPFFLWVSFQDPHMPFVAPSPWFERYASAPLPAPSWDPVEFEGKPGLYRAAHEGWFGRLRLGDRFGVPGFADMDHRGLSRERTARWIAAYYAMVSLLDHHLGRILDALDGLGLAERTLVVFTSDHGELLGQHGLWGKGPFHVEDVLRVPFLVRWPGHVPAGRRTHALQSLVDVVPTVLAAAGLEPPPHLAGRSQLAVWQGATEAIRHEVLVENRVSDRLYLKTVVTADTKCTLHLPGTEGELYDLVRDPGERTNLWPVQGPAPRAAAALASLLSAQVSLEPPPPARQAYA